VNIAAHVIDESIKEIVNELGLQTAHQAHLDKILIDERGAATKVDGNKSQGFIHRQNEVAGAVNALAIAEGFREELPEHDAGVFDRVVLIDVEVAAGLEREIEAAVLREQLEHMVEKANARRYIVATASFELERALDLGLFGVPGYGGGSHEVYQWALASCDKAGRWLMSSMIATAFSSWNK
jgi:hypothetical protein